MAAQRNCEGRRVLVVEDELTIVLVIEEALLDLGIQVIGPAARFDAALSLARNSSIDAAILDINIRGGNSYAVADALVERRIPFLFCSGYGERAVEERHRDRPRLVKPYSLRELEERVLQLFDESPGPVPKHSHGLAEAVPHSVR